MRIYLRTFWFQCSWLTGAVEALAMRLAQCLRPEPQADSSLVLHFPHMVFNESGPGY